MKLRRGDCGHWIPADMPSVAVTEGGPAGDVAISLCNACWDQARNQQAPKVETKVERKVIEPTGQEVEVERTQAVMPKKKAETKGGKP